MKYKEEYLQRFGVFCPYCKSEDVFSGKPEVHDHHILLDNTCNSCLESWTDIYNLADVEEKE